MELVVFIVLGAVVAFVAIDAATHSSRLRAATATDDADDSCDPSISDTLSEVTAKIIVDLTKRR